MRFAAALSLAAVQALCFGADLQIRQDASPLRLFVEKTGLYSGKTHVFEFHSYSGSLQLNEANPSASQVNLTVRAASFQLKDEWVSEKNREEIVSYTRSDKVLWVEKFPEIRFQSSSAEKTTDGWRVTGQLAVRGVEKPVTLTVTESRQGLSITFTGKAAFGMRQFGIKPPSAALGLIGTKDEMRLEFAVQAVP
jgi:polyisoprenoid-binding protein YceI